MTEHSIDKAVSPKSIQDGNQLTKRGKRRQRLTEQQTREAMLSAAMDTIGSSGLSLGLEDISMEEIIRDARVSRTTAYRCWPTKDLFVADLILELATYASPLFDTDRSQAGQALREQVLPRLSEVGDPADRWALAVEYVGNASVTDFEIARENRSRWQIYFALVAMLPQLPEGPLRDHLQSSLSTMIRRYRERLISNYRLAADLLGFRLVNPQRASLEQAVDLLIALWRGLILQSQVTGTDTDDDNDRNDTAQVESTARSPLPGLGAQAILTYCFEVDPTIDWNAHLAKVRGILAAEGNTSP